MDAGERFHRLRLINLEVELAALLWNREDASARQAFKRVGRHAAEHPDAKVKIIAGIDREQDDNEPEKNPFDKSGRGHAASIAEPPSQPFRATA